jgi:cyclophilin family peptidyl-prolyl cis-trans isomerase
MLSAADDAVSPHPGCGFSNVYSLKGYVGMRTLLCFLAGVLLLGVAPAWAAAPVVPEAPTVLVFGGVGSVAIRPLAAIAGGAVTEDGTKAVLTYDKHTLQMTVDKTEALQDGAKVTLPAAPFVLDGVTYAPLRAVVTALGGVIAPVPEEKKAMRLNFTGVAPFNVSLLTMPGKPEEQRRRAADLFLIPTDGSKETQLTFDVTEPTLMNRRSAHFVGDGIIVYAKGMDVVRRALNSATATNLTANSSANKIVSGNVVPLPDGSLLVMQLNLAAPPTAQPTPDISWIRADNAGFKKLATGVLPQVSADGKLIAYMDISKGEIPTIHVMKADGSDDKALAEGMLTALKPDGSALVYAKIKKEENGGLNIDHIVAITIADGKEIPCPEKDAKPVLGPLGAFSPDGKRLVVMQQGTMEGGQPKLDEQGIWIMDADLGNRKQLTKERDRSPMFSPDGSKIAFVRNSQLYIMKADGSEEPKLLAPAAFVFDFAFSPDGTKILADGIALSTFPVKPPPMPKPAPKPTVKPGAKTTINVAPTKKEIDAAKAAGTRQAVIKTSKGDIVVELYGKDAPLTTANFVKLAQAKFYNGLTFHRVEPEFVIQGGDPEGNGMGGPGYSIKLEISPKLKHVEGALAMARSQDPDSAGSQFYITLAPQTMLDGQYAVFGKTIKGMDVVKKIAVGDKIISITVK